MFELRIERRFFASHALRLGDGSSEPAHAHDWGVWVDLRGAELDALGLVMDFHELERIVGATLDPLRGANLNTHSALEGANPSAERIAQYLYRAISAQLPPGVTLAGVTVEESPGCHATFITGSL